MSMPACIDIFALDDAEKYLIFKDGRYVKMKCLRDELPAAGDTWPKLHDYYRDGDHYIAHIMRPKSSSHPLSSPSRNEFQIRAFRFYIIYRDRADYNVIQLDIKDSGHDRLGECISNSDQSILRKRKLDDSYRGGDFYLSKGSEFYVVFKESNTFLRTSSLFKKPAVQIQHHKLHKDLCNGLYYFATTNFIYAVIAADNDFVYCRTPDLQSVEKEQSAFPVHPSVAEVLRNGVPLQRRSWTNETQQNLEDVDILSYYSNSYKQQDSSDYKQQDYHSATCCCCIRKRPAEERSRLQLGVAGTLGGLVGGAIGAIIGLLVGVVIFATVDAAGASITLSIGATIGSAVFTAIGAVLFCLIYYFCTCN